MSFYSSLTPAERQALLGVATERTFARGARIMREGEPGSDVIVILEGRALITISTQDGERELAERGPGQLIGERAALRVHVRSATVTATEMVRGLVLTTGEFARFISAYPRVLDVVENQIYARLTEDPDSYSADGWPGMFPLGRVSPEISQRQQPLVGENCTVILTDVVEFGARIRSDRDRQIIRREGLEMMQKLLGPLWGECVHEDRGDGLLIVAPPQVITAKIMECIHRELPGKLRLHNRTYTKSVRIRLRIAVNVGPVMSDPLGMSGDSIIRTARLVEAPVLKDAMRETNSELGIIVSEFVYDTVVGHAPEYIDPDKYQRVEVISKEFKSPAWMQLEGGGPGADSDLPGPVGYGAVYLRVAGVAGLS
jgi:Cyclic nucleotide-binding domain